MTTYTDIIQFVHMIRKFYNDVDVISMPWPHSRFGIDYMFVFNNNDNFVIRQTTAFDEWICLASNSEFIGTGLVDDISVLRIINYYESLSYIAPE